MNEAPVRRRRGSHDLTANHKRLYQLIRRAGPLSRADLMRRSSLTFPSVSRLVAELLVADMLREGASRRGGMGKPPVELTINPDHSYSLGVHLAGDKATGSFVNALGEAVETISLPAASSSDGITNAIDTSGLDSNKLIGVCITTSGEPLAEEEQERLATESGVPVFAESAIAASVRAERYFGNGHELSRFLYFDAYTLELGAVVGSTVLAQPGTLTTLLGGQRRKASANSISLPEALKGAVVLLQAQALVVNGLSAEDLEALTRQVGDLPVLPASEQAGDPALAVAVVPLDKVLSV